MSSETGQKAKRRTTIRDVARLAQVAPVTVSRVVNNSGYISHETRTRVEAAIQQLNYIPNRLAQSLRYQKTHMVALIVSDITNPFWTTLARGVEDACSKHNLSVIVCNTDEQQEKLDNYINLLLQRQIDGLLIVPTEGYNSLMLENLVASRVPCIMLDRILPDRQNLSVVRSDSVMGCYLLTRHLLELGHRRIVMLSGGKDVSTGTERAEGYRRALTEAGIPLTGHLIYFGKFTQQSGYQMTMKMLHHVHPLPTAVITANNFIAFGALTALDEQHIRIPQDISLATFDDLPTQINPRPFLTSVAQDPYRMGQEAVQRLTALLEDGDDLQPQDVVLPVKLIIRASTAPPREDPDPPAL
jgi:LacI family transcriptional regulator